MSKKCIKCDAVLEDDVVFCDKCGTKQEAQEAASTASVADEATKESVVDGLLAKCNMSKNSVIAIAGIAVAAVVVIALLASLLAGSGYKKPIKAELKALTSEKYEKYAKTFPEEFSKEIEDKRDKDFEDIVEDSTDSAIEMIEEVYDKDFDLEYEIIDSAKLNEDELDDINDDIKDAIDEKDVVKKGYNVCVKVSIDDGDNEFVEYNTVTVVKAFGKWCIWKGSLIASASSI